MRITEELRKVLEAIEPHFFGSVEIGIQNGVPGHAKITTTYKLSREIRDNNGNRTPTPSTAS